MYTCVNVCINIYMINMCINVFMCINAYMRTPGKMCVYRDWLISTLVIWRCWNIADLEAHYLTPG